MKKTTATIIFLTLLITISYLNRKSIYRVLNQRSHPSYIKTTRSYSNEIQSYEKKLHTLKKKAKERQLSIVNKLIALESEIKEAKNKLIELENTGQKHRENVQVDLEYLLEYIRASLKVNNSYIENYKSSKKSLSKSQNLLLE